LQKPVKRANQEDTLGVIPVAVLHSTTGDVGWVKASNDLLGNLGICLGGGKPT
jgi:hypothetical protein